MLLEMRVMDSDWCQVTSPRAFMVIDDKGGEEHGLKLKKKRRREENLSSECVCFSRTGLTGLLDRFDRSPFLYSETVIISYFISFVDLRTCNV